MEISIVIPTYNRKTVLLSLLQNLNNLSFTVQEVIIVDSGTQTLSPAELSAFQNITIKYISAEPSVCIQRNIGIKLAKASWIFLCDDDLEVPPDYLTKLIEHLKAHPEAGAASGLVLQKDTGEWMEQYPITSSLELWWRFIFQLSIWGEITCDGFLSGVLKNYYKKKGNHLSKAGWPVVTQFVGDYFKTPVYGLGASLVKREWLLNSPYDEVLDPHGIGDNYGVAAGFSNEGIHVVKKAYVYHHKVIENRLQRPIQYYRRGLALDYFLTTKKELQHIWKIGYWWSLLGNTFFFVFSGNNAMIRSSFALMRRVIFGNPYVIGKKSGRKVIKPEL